MTHIAENYYENHSECSEVILNEEEKINNSIYFQKKSIEIKQRFYIRLVILTVALNILFIYAAFSQLVTNNNIGITLISGTQVTVKGDIQNNPGTTINNSGTIDMTGNWINNSGSDCFGLSQGTVILNGGNQNIDGANATLFNNLTMQGSGTKTLMVNTTVGGNAGNGALNINDKILELNSKTITINNPSSAAVAFTNGMIHSEQIDNSSKVQWNIGSTTGNHIIPFGNYSGVQIPLNINLTGGDIGDVTASSYPTAPDNTPLPVTPTLVTHVRDMFGNDNSANTVDRFWQIDKSGPTGEATITFTYAPSEAPVAGINNPYAQRWDPAVNGWDPALPGQNNPTIYSTTVPLVYNYGAWTLSLQQSPLPVELVQFDVKAIDNKYVKIEWVTETEINNDFFTVERSKDGKSFEEFARVNGYGSTTERHEYKLNDKNPYEGISYYRLKQTDFNGDQYFFDIKSVLISSDKSVFQVFPNPFIDYITVLNTSDDESSEIIISDVGGKTIFRADPSDSGIQKIDLSNLTSGIYFLTLKSSSESQTMRLVKTK